MTTFSVLSLNTFGVPFYLSLGRIKRLAMELNRLAPTVVCLQEIQQNAYLPLLKRGLTGYPNQAYFRNPLAPKGGLFSTSTCPVTRSDFYPFPNQGRALSIGFADWALNKGVLVINLVVDEHKFVIMNTHLQANYRGDWRASNSQTKIQVDQVNYLIKLVQAQPNDAWVILCGDFNFPHQSPAYQEMIAKSGMIDALADDPRPTYLPFPLVSSKWQVPLDYMFYRKPEDDFLTAKAEIIPIVNSSARLQFQNFLTDHCALLLSIG
jgi:endonuclease/exonuclease/phosphatase family metal-dependent hydrolase